MTKDEALNLALYALELEDMACRYEKEATPEHIAKAITALRTAIEEAEKQEPVACVIDGDLYFHHEIDWEDLAYQGHGVELLYTTPPAQPADLNLNCKSVQARLATQWGYVKAETADHSEQHLDMVDHADELTIAYMSGVHTGKKMKREWVSLTDEDIAEAGQLTVEGPRMLPYAFARAIEAKLKEKNHG